MLWCPSGFWSLWIGWNWPPPPPFYTQEKHVAADRPFWGARDGDNTEGWGKMYSDPGSLMTLQSLDQDSPEAKGVSASLSQYPLIKSFRKTPLILASVVFPALRWVPIKVNSLAWCTSPPLKAQQLETKPKPNKITKLDGGSSSSLKERGGKRRAG